MEDLKVIFDVGARDTTYPEEYPKATCHLFEPNIIHFQKLLERYRGNKKVILNNYGLGDKEETLMYDPYSESCVEGTMRDYAVQINTLDWYIKENNIERIDFLKIDTENMDFRVLQGGSKAIEMTRYIQYEYWDDITCFHDRLITEFNMNYIGERNVFCTRK